MLLAQLLRNKGIVNRLMTSLILIGSALLLSGCFDSSEQSPQEENVVDTSPIQDDDSTQPNDDNPTNNEPTFPDNGNLSRLSTSGINWVNERNEIVDLRGVNIGNWLLQELWMMEQSVSNEVHDQCTLEAKLRERFGKEEQQRLISLFQDNWITDRDWDLMQEFEMNVIRLPFLYSLIEDDDNPYNLRDDAWVYLDYAIEQASLHGMYTILDLHGAAGSQGWQDHSGCSDKNEYWSNEEYKDRTRWLWQRIAARYKDNKAVAGYNLLNEPWGTNESTMAREITLIHDAIREIDEHTIIILNGHFQGIDAYGNPHDKGMTNIAFDMHFYPGIFGWDQISYEVNRDWLTCGKDGNTGVCGWAEKMESIQSPLLVGEFQPWTGMGELSGQNTRATFDKYNELGWAATGWAWKTVSKGGGIGGWGLVSNKGEQLISKFSTWDCESGTESNLENGCASGLAEISNSTSGDIDLYLIIKAGSCCEGLLDVVIDSIGLIDKNSGENIVKNGEFGSDTNWTLWHVDAAPNTDFSFLSDTAPANSEGAMLRLSGSSDINGGVYQKVTLADGKTYNIEGVMKDLASQNAWLEIYLVETQPEVGVDVVAEAMKTVDFTTATIEEIEDYYEQFSTQQYEREEKVLQWMKSSTSSDLYTLPASPQNLSLEHLVDGVQLTWSANTESNLAGYRVYRGLSQNSTGTLLASITDTNYLDISDLEQGTRYYYWVTALDTEDESFASSSQSILTSPRSLPGQIEMENYDAMSGIQTETSYDEGNGVNIGYIDGGDWVEFEVDVTSSGTYLVEYRVASEQASGTFYVNFDESIIDSKTVPSTSGWQNWTTLSSELELTSGAHTMRVNFTSGPFNFNWIRFSKVN